MIPSQPFESVAISWPAAIDRAESMLRHAGRCSTVDVMVSTLVVFWLVAKWPDIVNAPPFDLSELEAFTQDGMRSLSLLLVDGPET